VIPLIPEWFISAFAVATVFVVMFHLGLGLLRGSSSGRGDAPG